jgi:hypothetical protein
MGSDVSRRSVAGVAVHVGAHETATACANEILARHDEMNDLFFHILVGFLIGFCVGVFLMVLLQENK